MSSGGHSSERLPPVLAALRRKWLIVVIVVLVVTAGSLVVSLRTSPVYRSTAKVLIADRDLAGAVAGVPESALSSANLATEAQIASLPTVLQQAKASLGDPDSDLARDASVALRIASTAGTSGESNILDIEADSTDPDYSARLATATAEGYVAFRRDLATREIRSARDDLAQKLQDLADAGRSGGQLYADLSGRLQQLETLLILGGSPASLLEGGEPATQVEPQPIRSGVLGFLVGLLVGALAAVVGDRLDRRARSHDEISSLLGAPVLALLPDPRRRDGLPSVVARTDRSSPGAEAFRTLRTHLKFVLATRGGRAVLVTSGSQGEGKTYVATNVALSAASAGDDVILIDADLRSPNAHRYLALPGAPGLTDVVAGETSLESALITVALPAHASPTGRLRFLPAGRRIPNPGEFIASDAVAAHLSRLASSDAGLVIIDTPPVLPVSDATALAAVVDTTLVVVRADSADRSSLDGLRSMLTTSAHHCIGLVLTASWGRRATYGERYSYGPTPTDDPSPLPPSANGGESTRTRVNLPY